LIADHGPDCQIDGFATIAGFEGNKWQQMATNGRKWQQPQSFQRIPKRRLSDMKKLDMFATRFNLLAKSVAQMGAVVLILTGESEVI